jgi:hypothetical protein
MIEVLASDRKIWKYERRLIAVGAYVRLTLGRFPRAHSGRRSCLSGDAQRTGRSRRRSS